MNIINNFTVVESIYGRFIVNRHCSHQAEALIKTGIPHIQSELKQILTIVSSLPNECLIIDAGANIGLVSVPIAQAVKGKHGVVHSFEPQRMLFYALCGTAALNDLENLVLKGARRMINAHRPWCWIEYWKVDRNAIKAAFEDLGYRFYLMDHLNMLCAPGSRVVEQRIDVRAQEV